MRLRNLWCLILVTVSLYGAWLYTSNNDDHYNSSKQSCGKDSEVVKNSVNDVKFNLDRRSTGQKKKNITKIKLQNRQNIRDNRLPKVNKNRPIVFLHIGKNGGTALRKVVRRLAKELNLKYIGTKHFDWSYVETIPNADVLLMLRNPIPRSVSHYYFMRKWSKNKLNQGSLSEYLNNVKEMLFTRDCWQDGQASVAWLTGTHIGNWVGIKAEDVPLRELKSLNISDVCRLAAKRLESTFWFGILEDLERSYELLQYQLGLTHKIKAITANKNDHAFALQNETRVLESLMPQDIWLYNYGKLLFEARWTYYKTGVYKHPEMPPVPSLESVPCISTRSALLCKKGPLRPLSYIDYTSKHYRKIPEEILHRFDYEHVLFKNVSNEVKTPTS